MNEKLEETSFSLILHLFLHGKTHLKKKNASLADSNHRTIMIQLKIREIWGLFAPQTKTSIYFI